MISWAPLSIARSEDAEIDARESRFITSLHLGVQHVVEGQSSIRGLAVVRRDADDEEIRTRRDFCGLLCIGEGRLSERYNLDICEAELLSLGRDIAGHSLTSAIVRRMHSPELGQHLRSNGGLGRLDLLLDRAVLVLDVGGIHLLVQPHGEVQRTVKTELRVVNHCAFCGVFYLEVQNDPSEDDLNLLKSEVESDTAART